jgi:hypothetical protein
MAIVESAAVAYLSRYYFEDMRASLPEGARDRRARCLDGQRFGA